jgi:hypothetical protein
VSTLCLSGRIWQKISMLQVHKLRGLRLSASLGGEGSLDGNVQLLPRLVDSKAPFTYEYLSRSHRRLKFHHCLSEPKEFSPKRSEDEPDLPTSPSGYRLFDR